MSKNNTKQTTVLNKIYKNIKGLKMTKQKLIKKIAMYTGEKIGSIESMYLNNTDTEEVENFRSDLSYDNEYELLNAYDDYRDNSQVFTDKNGIVLKAGDSVRLLFPYTECVCEIVKRCDSTSETKSSIYPNSPCQTVYGTLWQKSCVKV